MVAKTQGGILRKFQKDKLSLLLSCLRILVIFSHICAHLASFLIWKLKFIFTLHSRDFYFLYAHDWFSSLMLWYLIVGHSILHLRMTFEWSYTHRHGHDFDSLRGSSWGNLLHSASHVGNIRYLSVILVFIAPLHSLFLYFFGLFRT